jgi:hypothetical protein
MVQAIESLLSKWEALSANPSTNNDFLKGRKMIPWLMEQ